MQVSAGRHDDIWCVCFERIGSCTDVYLVTRLTPPPFVVISAELSLQCCFTCACRCAGRCYRRDRNAPHPCKNPRRMGSNSRASTYCGVSDKSQNNTSSSFILGWFNLKSSPSLLKMWLNLSLIIGSFFIWHEQLTAVSVLL